jgi:ceramide glucosyltransferase
VAILATLRFFLRERKRTLGEFAPPVSVLKPVHGVDFASYENFLSFCRQNYSRYEILFCVNDLSDSAVPLILRLIAAHPQLSIRLLLGAEELGSNRKVNNLVLLAKEARYELLVQSDGDVAVGPNYLREVAALFEDPQTAAVSCFYRGMAEPNFWAEIEALGAATDFAPSVAVADWKEGVRFALGASVATTKSWLQKTGGYAALANVLADDYEIGNRMARAGGRVWLSREVVTTMYPAQTFAGYWQHQLRWARTVRLCRPWSYWGLLFTHGLPWAVIGAVISGSTAAAVGFLLAYLLTRWSLAWTMGVWGLHDATTRRKWWLIPFRDALHFAVWLGGFASNRITWGETEFRLMAGGEMVQVGSPPPAKK